MRAKFSNVSPINSTVFSTWQSLNKNLLHETRNRLTDLENKLMVTKGEVEWEEFGISRCKLLLYKINSKVLLYSPGN